MYLGNSEKQSEYKHLFYCNIFFFWYPVGMNWIIFITVDDYMLHNNRIFFSFSHLRFVPSFLGCMRLNRPNVLGKLIAYSFLLCVIWMSPANAVYGNEPNRISPLDMQTWNRKPFQLFYFWMLWNVHFTVLLLNIVLLPLISE